MKPEIRRFQPADLNELLSAWENASREAHAFLTEAFFIQERVNIPNVYLPNADTWVVLDNGKVVGFIALIDQEVGGFFIDPVHQGKGLGRALLDQAHSLHSTLELDVFKKNTIGRHFYQIYGFRCIGEKMHEETAETLLRLRYERN